MENWIGMQRGWSPRHGVGDHFSQSWWAAFETTVDQHREQPRQPHVLGYDHHIFGRPGTGYDPEERPYGMPELENVNYTTFH